MIRRDRTSSGEREREDYREGDKVRKQENEGSGKRETFSLKWPKTKRGNRTDQMQREGDRETDRQAVRDMGDEKTRR